MFTKDNVIEARYSNPEHDTIIVTWKDMDNEFESYIQAGSADHNSLKEAGWDDSRIEEVTVEWKRQQSAAVYHALRYAASGGVLEEVTAEIEVKKRELETYKTKVELEKEKYVQSYNLNKKLIEETKAIKEKYVKTYNLNREIKSSLEKQKERYEKEVELSKHVKEFILSKNLADAFQEDTNINPADVCMQYILMYNNDEDMVKSQKEKAIEAGKVSANLEKAKSLIEVLAAIE